MSIKLGKVSEIGIRNCEHWLSRLPAFPRNHRFPIDPQITWVVGENGTGKSSFLKFLFDCETTMAAILLEMEKILTHEKHKGTEKPKPNDLPVCPDSAISTALVDVERMNPRVAESWVGDKINDWQIGAILNKSSHGQVTWSIMDGLGKMDFKEGTLLLIDEPEAGLSPWNQVKALEAFKKIIADGKNQIIAATHSLIFIRSGIGSVLDLNTGPATLTPTKKYKFNPPLNLRRST